MATDTEDLVLSISADVRQMQRALARITGDTDRATSAMQKAFDGVGSRTSGVFDQVAANSNRAAATVENSGRRFSRAMSNSRTETANLAAQLQDIGVQLQSGSSPLTIALQQGTQIGAVLGNAGAAGAVRALGTAFASVLNPVNLVTIGLIAAGGYAVQYFSEGEDEGEDFNKTLKKQADLIQSVAQRWGDAIPALREYADQLKRAAEEADLRAVTEMRIEEVFAAAKEQVKDLSYDLQDLVDQLQSAGVADNDIVRVQRAFEALQKAVDANKDSAAENRELMSALSTVYINNNIPAADEFARKIYGIADAFAEVARKAEEARRQEQAALEAARLAGFTSTLPGNLGQLTPVYSGGGRLMNPGEFQDYRAGQTQSQFQVEQEKTAERSSRAAKEAAETIDRAIASQTAVAVDAATRLLGRNENANAGDINAFLRAGGVDLNAATTAWCAAFVNSALAQVGVKGSGSNVATDFLNWGVNVDPSQIQRGDVLVDPNGRSAGQTGGHVGFATGLVRFQEGILQLQMLSGNASDKVQEDWVNASDVVARRAAEAFQVPADALRHLGQESAAAKAAAEAHALAIKQQQQAYEQLGQIGQTAINGIENALADGKIEGQELLQIVMQIVQQMLSMPRGGLGGGGGLFGGLIIPGILHKGGMAGRDGYGHGRAVSPSVFAGAQRYHSGGIAGLRPGEVPAILQRGEIVIPKGGAAARPQGVHVTVGVSADNNGNLMPFVESVSERKAVVVSQQGFARYDKELNRTIGGKIANAQARQL